MNPKALQYIMGHANIIMTLNYYAHADFDSPKAEMDHLDTGMNVGIVVSQSKDMSGYGVYVRSFQYRESRESPELRAFPALRRYKKIIKNPFKDCI